MNTRTPEGHRLADAFRLMWYADEVTGERERIWNSRDGVTAFITSSRAGNNARHVDRHLDVYAPLHLPQVGDRVWVTLTYERALAHRRRFVETYWAHPQYPVSEHYPSKEAAAEDLAHADVFNPDGTPNGWPELVKVDDALLEELTRARDERLRQLVRVARVALADSDGQVVVLPGTQLALVRSEPGLMGTLPAKVDAALAAAQFSGWGSTRQDLEALTQELPVFLDDTKRREDAARPAAVQRLFDPSYPGWVAPKFQRNRPSRAELEARRAKRRANKERRKRQRKARQRQAQLRRKKTGRR